MSISRRGFLLATSSLAAASLAGTRAWARVQPVQPAAPARPVTRQVQPSEARYFEWKKAGGGVHVAFGEGGNTLVMLGKDESLLVDTKNCGFGDTLRLEAVALGSPIGLVLNTHHHADHTGGNSVFAKDLPLLAHTKAKARIAANAPRYTAGAKSTVSTMFKSPKLSAKGVRESAMLLSGVLDELNDPAKVGALFEPTRTTEGNETLTVGGRTVELTHVGAGHTDNDLIVFIPEANVLHTGDLLFHRVWPYVDRGAGANTAGWIASLERILTICNGTTVVVPGHGELTDRSGVQGQIEFFKKMRDVAGAAVKDGTSREDFLKRPFEEYKDYGMADFIKPVTLGGLYDEAAGVPAK